ncbi:tetratricopeptide repeat protein [uncultured Fusobacterium sp.]|uniref:tetratricopeptide repeat protein n=1 Tax=uncultured Fusobacterium sp. TaxID=159267 RepID=UPI0027DB16B9|nr:tetratricopeptide repeat protein [uncultured Fusobacterium sp.]
MRKNKIIFKFFSSIAGTLSVIIAYRIFGISLEIIVYGITAVISFLLLIKLWRPVYTANIIKNMLPILNEQCDPQTFLEKSAALLVKPFLQNTNEYSFILLNMAVGYFAQGNIDKAVETARKISENDIEKNHYLKIIYLYNMASFYISEEHWNTAEIFVSKLQNYAELLKNSSITKDGKNIEVYLPKKKHPEYFPVKNINEIETMLEELTVLLGLKNKKYNEAIELYEKKFNRNNNKYIKSYCKYYQAIWYEELGDIENMKKSLTYTAENGNKLHIAIAARDILKEYHDLF